MEENSKAYMETDVSSTTDDVPENQEVTGSHGDVEMVLAVENPKQECNSSIDLKDEQTQGSKISSASTSSQKATSPQKITIKPLSKESSNLKQMSSVDTESQKVLSKTSQVSNKTSPVKQQLESSDSPTKVETKLSPGKSIEKSFDKSPVKISQGQKIIHKSPFKDMKLVSKSPVKLIRVQESNPKEIGGKDKSPIKIVCGRPEEVNQPKTSNEEVRLQETCPNTEENSRQKLNKQTILQENSSKNIQENKTKEVKSQEIIVTKEKLVESTFNKETKLVKDSEKLDEPTSNKRLVESSSNQKFVEQIPKTMSDEPTSIKKLVESTSKKEATLVNSNKEEKVGKKDSATRSKDVSLNDSSSVNNKVSIHDVSISKIIKTVNGDEKMGITGHPTEEDISNDMSNNSQNSTDVTEKEHNKSISRELKSLINSAKESKIISECTQLKSKTRKSRSQLDSSNTSLNISLEAEKVGNRRGSTNSQASNSSEKSERALKRSMRSHNPEFVSKCKQFLNAVTSKVTKDSDEAMSEDETSTNSKEKTVTAPVRTDATPPSPKKKKVSEQPVLDDNGKPNKNRSDIYCWRCHWTVEQDGNDKAHPPMRCTVCPRAYHFKCLSTNERKTTPEKNWVCPDCLQILHAESSDTRSPAMKKTSLGMLCDLLKYALERMMDLNGVEPFLHPVDRTVFPDYDKYVVHPMDLSQMKQNIADGLYGSTEAFVADAQWILHNSIIFNTLQSKLTAGARALVRSCRAEMGEIEACPECYAAAHARRPTWFTDVCTTPHILLWAKLKGFPYWPAKGMTVNGSGLVDVRFFGAHDRAWVPAKDCFLFSEKDPNNFRNKRQDILDAMQEAEQHIRSISRKYGKFVYPPFKTQFDPSKITEQLKMMIPSFEGEIRTQIKDKPANPSPLTAKVKRRSTSKGSSKSSTHDGDGSEAEDTCTSARTEATRSDKENSSEKVSKVDSPVVAKKPSLQTEEPAATRKRRRSQLEEAVVMTVIETSIPEKKRKYSTEQNKPEPQQPSSSKEEKTQSKTKESEVTESTSKKKTDTPKSKSKDEEPSSSMMEEKESLRVTPIKLIALPRENKQTPKLFTTTKIAPKATTPKADDKTPQRVKLAKLDKSSTSDRVKEHKAKAQKHRNSRSNKSLDSAGTPKSSKTTEKKTDSTDSTSGKELRPRESKKKETEGEANKSLVIDSLIKPIEISKPVKDRSKFDDNTSLAVLARERRRSNAGLPTITSVCSLSTTAQASTTTVTPTTSAAQIEITVEASSTSSIFTPTSTDSVLNMKDAVNKLQKLRDNTEPVVGRVGVRAFARMTSPGLNDKVEVEIKAEPIDLEESDEGRHNEKMDLMNACKLQPVSQTQSLRDVRITRTIGGPSLTVKKGSKVEARPRARKTFPQPRREEGRSELNGKNSMVYIPIQPPATQPPVRPTRPTLPAQRPLPPLTTVNNSVNTVITPLKPNTSTISSPPCSAPTVISPTVQVSVPTVAQMPTAGQLVNAGQISTFGQIANAGQVPTVGPTTVHTVPLMTSVNGQWMFSLQPVMSVGGVDSSATTPMLNGLTDRAAAPTVVPLPSATPAAAATPTTPVQNRTASENNTPNELPRLQQRPALVHPFDASAAPLPPPSNAGPTTAKLNQHATQLADFFRTLLEESLEKTDDPTAVATTLRLQLEAARWRHSQELEEIKHNHELTLAEMRLTYEKDKQRVMAEVKRTAQAELDAAVKLAKSKQWCANCHQEAQFYCCWNTAYCDYPCQRVHWPQHYTHCSQRSKDGNEDETNPPESRLQPQPDVLPKSAPPQAPTLTVGGKVAVARVVTPQDAASQKAQIIVSMVEDNSGNQTMKCVGTYKPNQTQSQAPPLVINKQVLTDDASKKVVTSGGYLIVGAAGSTASVITPAPPRRSQAIQYFS